MRLILLPFLLSLATSIFARQREPEFDSFYSKNVETKMAEASFDYFQGKKHEGKDVKIRYLNLKSEAPKAIIVSVHGFGERIEKYYETFFDFNQAGYDIFALDQRGHGKSTRLNSTNPSSVHVTSFDDYVDDLEYFINEIVKKNNPKNLPIFIYAHSMGGCVSSMLLLRKMEIDAIVLSAPMHEIATMGVSHELAATIIKAINFFGFGEYFFYGQSSRGPWTFEQSAAGSFTRWEHYEKLRDTFPEEERMSGASFLWSEAALDAIKTLKTSEEVVKIDTPILLFQAGKDRRVLPEGQNHFCSKIASCRLRTFPESRHELYRDPDATREIYLNEVLSFFDEHL